MNYEKKLEEIRLKTNQKLCEKDKIISEQKNIIKELERFAIEIMFCGSLMKYKLVWAELESEFNKK